MLSKPKYMLPGNLSQGAPILEPDENGNYNFSFALDGDELVKKYRYKIYSLEPLELAKEDIELSLEDFYIIDLDTKEKKSLINYVKLYHIEMSMDNERNINFLANFSFPKDQFIYIDEEKYPQDNFLLSNYTGPIPFNFHIELSKWGVLSYLNVGSSQSENSFYLTKELWRTPVSNIFIFEGETNKFKTLNFSGTINLSFKKEKIEDKEIIGFICNESSSFTGKASYSYQEFRSQQTNNPFVKYDEEWYRTWGYDKGDYTIVVEKGGTKFLRSGSEAKNFFNQVTDLGEKIFYYYSAYYYYNDFPTPEHYPFTTKVPEFEDFSLNDIDDKNDFPTSNKYPLAYFVEFASYDDEEYYTIENSKIEINLKKNEQNLFLEDKFEIEEMPKNQRGQYNFFTFLLPKYNNEETNSLRIPPGHYCWGVEILKKDSFNEDEIIATSNYYHFDILGNKKECSLFIDKPKVSININDTINNNPYLLDYSFEVSNEKVLFYKSPWINSNNSTITFPFKYFPFEIDYSTTFTTTDLEQKTLFENNFFYPLKSEKYNKIIDFKEENEEISLKLKSENEIKNLSIFRVNKNGDKIIFIKKFSLEPNIQINIDDIGNNFSEYYYYFINDDTGEWQYSLDEIDEETGENNPVYHLNKNLDRWRLILTKGEKNDIIEEKRMCHYQVDKIYDFYYNLISGSIGNNAETTINTNFTNMPSVQKGFSNYWSGSLSALMGVCDERGEFAQTIEQEKALEQLVLDQEHDKFLLDREGNIWQVEISAPLTIANQDGLVQVDKLIDLKTITINWVQVGSPTQIVFDFEE